MSTTDTAVNQLIINRLTKTQFDGVIPSSTELWAVDPEFVGNKFLGTDVDGDIVEKPLRNTVTDTTSSTITLANAVAGTDYHYGTLTSLTVTANDTSDNEITIYFTAGSTISVTLPNTLQYIGSAPVFEPNTTYAISILNNICIAGAVG